VIVAFIGGTLFGVALTVGIFTLTQRRHDGLPLLTTPTATKLPGPVDSELELRKRLRANAIAKGADDILDRARNANLQVTREEAERQAAWVLDQTGFDT